MLQFSSARILSSSISHFLNLLFKFLLGLLGIGTIGVRSTKCSTKFSDQEATSFEYPLIVSSLLSFLPVVPLQLLLVLRTADRFARRNGSRRSSLSRPPEGRDCQPCVLGRPCLTGSPPPSSQRFTDRELVAAEESESERSSYVPDTLTRLLAPSLSLSSSLSPSFPLSLGRQGRPQLVDDPITSSSRCRRFAVASTR